MPKYQLAQLNIAKLREPLDSPAMADFVANLDRINALAEATPGFVWRLKDDEGNAEATRVFGEEFLVNLSVWENVVSLSNYVYQSGHVEIMRRRREWFDKMEEAYAVLWWVPKDHRPPAEEARERLAHLREFGATLRAFTFKDAFDAPDDEHVSKISAEA